MSNLLLSPVYQIDSYTPEDKIFRREYSHHIIRLGTEDGEFFVQYQIDQTLFQELLLTYDRDTILTHCEVVNSLYENTQECDTIDEDYSLGDTPKPVSNTPIIRTPRQLQDFLTTHTHTRYTGAGLSMHAGLPSMEQLKSALGIENHLGHEIDPCLTSLLTDPQYLEQQWMNFATKMKDCPPTPAHYAIVKLLHRYQNNILTENTDSLHQQSGIEPLMIDDPQAFRDAIPPQAMREIDAVITVGLGSGDRGFLGYYKTHHPHGIIIAINNTIPSYCGPEDIVVLGDCQEILPQIAG